MYDTFQRNKITLSGPDVWDTTHNLANLKLQEIEQTNNLFLGCPIALEKRSSVHNFKMIGQQKWIYSLAFVILVWKHGI